MNKLRIATTLFFCCCCLLIKAQETKGQDTVFYPEQFGAKGNGADDTVPLMQMIAAARKSRGYIYIPAQKTYVFNPVQTVNLSGIRGFRGDGMIDLSKAGKTTALKSVFLVRGEKELIAGPLHLQKGTTELSISGSEKIKAGDVLFITSAEPLPNPNRPYYCKGQRMVVKEMRDGKLHFAEPCWFNIEKAYIWRNSVVPSFGISGNLRFVTAPMSFLVCFSFFFCDVRVQGGYFKNFALSALMFKSSSGTVEKMKAELPVTDNNGYSYCIQVADMSDVTIRDCTLSGGRHVVSGGGGGLWEQEESGGKGHAGYPSVFRIEGGTYEGTKKALNINADNATIDSHGVVYFMSVKNCTVKGGFNLGADTAVVEGCTIEVWGKRAFNIGSDVLPGSNWGRYMISDCRIIGEGVGEEPFLKGKADVALVQLKQVTVEGKGNKAAFIDFSRYSPARLVLEEVRISGLPRQRNMLLGKNTRIFLKGGSVSRDQISQ